MSFTQIKTFILKNKKSILFLSFLVFLFNLELVFATKTGEALIVATETKESWTIITFLNYFIAWAWAILWMVTSFVWWFLTPEWTTGSAIWFDDKLKDLWILMSNVVYTIFALILIIIAFMNIIWKWENTWELKQAIPKFIVWVLIVPFSWFIVWAVIWLSSILTTAVLTIPWDSFPKTFENLEKVEFCKDVVYNVWDITAKWAWEKKKDPIECETEISFAKFIETNDNIFWIVSVYTYWVMKIDSNWKLFQTDIKNWIKSLADLTVKWIIDILFFIIFIILMIALLMALFMRWIYIWVFTVLSPLFWLLYFFWDKTPESLKNFTFSKFLWLAMMPVYVSAALSFWLLFILVAWEWMSESATSSKCEGSKSLCISESEGKEWYTIKFLWTSHTFNWSFWSAWETAGETIWSFKWAFGTMILQIFWLAIMWIAIMAALKSSELTQEVVKPIESFGSSVWQLAMKAPTYAPIIPAPGGWTMSAAWMWSFWQTMQSTIHSKYTWEGSTKATDLFWGSGAQRSLNLLRDSNIDLKNADKANLQKYLNEWLVKLNNKEITKNDFDKMINQINSQWWFKDKKSGSKLKAAYWTRENQSFINLLKDELNAHITTHLDINDITKAKNYMNSDWSSTKPNGPNAAPINPNTGNTSNATLNVTLPTISNKNEIIDSSNNIVNNWIKDIYDTINNNDIKNLKDSDFRSLMESKLTDSNWYWRYINATEANKIVTELIKLVNNDANKNFK